MGTNQTGKRTMANQRLKHERERRGWSLGYVAASIDCPDPHTVGRWERGTSFPSPRYRQALCELFGKDAQELGLISKEPEGKDKQALDPSLQEPDEEFSVTSTDVRTIQGDEPLEHLVKMEQMPKNNLPVQLTSLIGREQERAAGCTLLHRPEVRLLTLTGPGGIGKTRLAIHLATNMFHTFADGVCFVSLASINDPDVVLPTIAYTLGLREAGDWPLLERLQVHLQDKQMLLLLDNFEQIVTAAPQLVELLAACPQLKALVTSRAALRVRGEYEFPVAPLALPNPAHMLEDSATLSRYPAIALFVQRAQAIKPDFQLTAANARVIAEICLRLDGLPLAIELAATRIKLLPPPALLARLEHRLDVLVHAPQDLPVRHQTLRSTLAWSYSLLTAEEQRLFRRLSVFVGGCTLEAIEAVCAALDTGITTVPVLDAVCTALDKSNEAERVLYGVASLIDKSFLQQTRQEGDEPRLVILETNREYGWEVLVASGELETTRQAHATYYLRLAEEAEPELVGPQQIIWFERLEREHDNLRAALSWFLKQSLDAQRRELALRLSGALSQFWGIRGYVSEGRQCLEQALDESRGVRSSVRAKALMGAGTLATLQGDLGQAEALCGESLALYRELGDTRGMAFSLSSLGHAALMRSNYAAARALEEEALALFREGGDMGGSVFPLYLLAAVLFYQGEYGRAHALLEESLVLSREGGDVQRTAVSLMLLGAVLLFQGDLARAHARFEESLAVSREVGYKQNIGLSIFHLGIVAHQQGDVAGARSLLEESLVLFKEGGERGRIAEVFLELGLISFHQGDYAAARARMEESLQIARELDHKWNIAVCLEGLAVVVAAQGEPVRAVWFMSAAQALREAIATPLPSPIQAMHEYTIASARTQLGEQAFAAAWAEGCIMTPEQALATKGRTLLSTAVPLPLTISSVPPAKSSAPSPAGLTAREVEVLRLVAQGLTDAQVAEQLVISPCTVNTHLKSIYGKIQVTSRSAATRYAIEHQQLL